MAKSLGFSPIVIMGLLLLTTPTLVLAHSGHGNEFKGTSEATNVTKPIKVDTQTAQRLEIKVEPVKRQKLAIAIKTTGQIETLPSQKVEVTTPISGAKVVELLVEPGAKVQKGQPIAVVSSLDLVELRVNSQEKLAQGQANLRQALLDLNLAQQNSDRYQQIANAEIAQTQSQVAFFQEKYNKDTQLANDGALARRTALESQTQLAEAKTKLTTANSRRDVMEAEAKVKMAQSSVELAKSNIRLSNTKYQTRLSQLGNRANAQGLITINAPITGKVADREATLGQTFEDAGGKLITIVNDSRVFATANIYEKDLNKVKIGQRVSLKVASVPNSTFSGRIAVVESAVAGDTRTVAVKAEIDNPSGVLKPGMFAELEVSTNQTSSNVLTIPNSAVVEANGKQQVYLQNGNAYQVAEVTLGKTSGDMVEVKTGLFEGDIIVTQRAPQLYAQSLRGGSKPVSGNQGEGDTHTEVSQTKTNLPILVWLFGAGGVAVVGVAAFTAGSFHSSRRISQSFISVGHPEYDDFTYEAHIDNHKQSTTLDSAPVFDQPDSNI